MQQQNYYELTLQPPQEWFLLFEDYLNFIYDEAIEELDGSIILRSEKDLDEVLKQSLEFAKNNNFDLRYNLELKQNQDWIEKYKQSIKPIKIDKFYIHPSWCEPSKELINIVLDPTLAFGSGHHETTSSCIEAISYYVKDKDELLDVGCGSGILALCGAKLGATVDLCDTDSLAVSNAQDNFKLNNQTINDIWCGSIQKSKKKYDIIIANIVADILIMLRQDLKNSLKTDGILILSGILDKYLDKVLQNFSNMKILKQINKNEWVTLILKDVNETK